MIRGQAVRGAVLCVCLLWSCTPVAAEGVQVKAGKAMQSPKRSDAVPAQREMTIEHPYLHLPVKNGGPKCRMRFTAGEETLREFEIELADADPDFWVFSDVSALTGRRITIHVDSLPEGSKGLGTIVQADAVPDAGLRPGVARPPSWRGDARQMYREKLRQQFHFSSRRGWNNDPNGLVYHAGEYHLYYQHNPYGWKWGNMHWGHAVSADLVHWKELPVAIYPHKFGDWVFSGSAAVDAENTGGFKTGREDVIVAAYTSTGRGECIAYSNDRGRTFTDFKGNPVVKHGGRDPKIIWYAPGSAEAKPGKHWVMAVYDQRDASKGIAFYTSPDLKAWEFQSRIEGYFECPEIFELPLECDPCQTRWVVYAASGDYSVGTFDGKTFTPESGKHKFSYGNCFYASQTFGNVLHEDGRRIQIAWGRIATPGMPFNQCMLFPVELTLRKTDDGPRLFAEPVREIAFLHAKKHSWRDQIVMPGENLLAGVAGDLFEIRADFEPGDAAEFGLSIRGTPVLYNVKAQEISCKGCKAPLKTEGGRIRMHILVDRTSIEVFANHGRVYMPVGIVHPDDNRSLETVSTGGAAKVKSLEVWELKSAWE